MSSNKDKYVDEVSRLVVGHLLSEVPDGHNNLRAVAKKAIELAEVMHTERELARKRRKAEAAAKTKKELKTKCESKSDPA